MRKKNRKEWFDRIARQAYSLPTNSFGLEFALKKDGASQEEIRYELKSRGVKFAIRSNNNSSDTLFVYPNNRPEQPTETAKPAQVPPHMQKYLESCDMLGKALWVATAQAVLDKAVLDTANRR